MAMDRGEESLEDCLKMEGLAEVTGVERVSLCTNGR